MGVPHPTCRKNEGKDLGRKHPELSEKRRVFARKKGEAGGEEVRPQGTQGRQCEVSTGGAHVRYVFVYLEMSLFPSVFCTVSAFPLYGEYVVRSFLPDGVFSTL